MDILIKLCRRVPAWGWPLVVASLLIFPGIGTHGLWEPTEVSHANAVAQPPGTGATTVVKPPLYHWIVSAGFGLLGVNERGGRVPIAVLGLLGLALIMRIGSRLFGTPVGILAALLWLTMPSFIFETRSLISDLPLQIALLAAVGGFASYIWPAESRPRSRGVAIPVDALLGALGLIAGFLSGGLLLGVLLPTTILALAMLSDFACISRRTWITLGTLVGLSGVAIALLWPIYPTTAVASQNFALYGGSIALPGRAPAAPLIGLPLREIGHRAFPWVALFPLVLVLLSEGSRRAAGRVTLLTIIIAYVAAFLWHGFLGARLYVALPWVALAAAAALVDLLRNDRRAPLVAAACAAVALVIQQDYFFQPQTLGFAHLTQPLKYPEAYTFTLEVRAFGIGFAALLFFAIAGIPAALPVPVGVSPTGWRRPVDRLLRLLARAINAPLGALRRFGGDHPQRRFVVLALLLGVGFAGFVSWAIIPGLSKHLSNKGIFAAYRRCMAQDEPLFQYQLGATQGASYYGDIERVNSLSGLVKRFAKPERVFSLIPARHLGIFEKTARKAQATYYVVDNSSSKVLLLTNKLSANCPEDVNPLRRYLPKERPTPQRALTANFDNKVRLLGFDLPQTVSRGGSFEITLYFEVLATMPSAYKLFIHFDKPSYRFHGDHTPLEGMYATQYWTVGDFISDTHKVHIPMLTTPSGSYRVYAGFWRGSARIKVTKGPNDGDNRVELGTLRVR